ncbi:IucA/IucC family C-terminal-domain containing protein [Salininema proteolyticum]|uniref:IucA/IucC family C-terminal-domain containing protein n=1 Tax=Salininema proteolyticum TaxID=1607685 RepID=A0ABV8TU50_9ACTN
MPHNPYKTATHLLHQRLLTTAQTEHLPHDPTQTNPIALAHTITHNNHHAHRLTTEIRRALHATTLALTNPRPHPTTDIWTHAHNNHPDPTTWFEQTILLGHPQHPLARLRGTWTTQEIHTYAPEHHTRTTLPLHQTPHMKHHPDWPLTTPDGQPLLPLHPWQAHRYQLTPTTTIPNTAPLMNLRTLTTGTHHYKTSIDLQLTSALRHITHTALTITNHQHQLQKTLHQHDIHLQTETWATATTPQGTPHPHLTAIARPTPPPRTLPLAAAAEPCPHTGQPLAHKIHPDPHQYLDHLIDTWLLPTLTLHDNTGIALEAHGQNSLITHDHQGLPNQLIYRDLGGIRLPPHWNAPTRLTAHNPTETTKVLHAALTTTLTQLIPALAQHPNPTTWWQHLAHRLHTHGGPSATQLATQPWPTKKLLTMRLSDHPTHNQWVDRPNPLTPQ